MYPNRCPGENLSKLSDSATAPGTCPVWRSSIAMWKRASASMLSSCWYAMTVMGVNCFTVAWSPVSAARMTRL